MKAELSKSSPSLFRISVSIFVVELVGIVSSGSRRRKRLVNGNDSTTNYEMN